jgi:RHS repeat-associated protein
MCKICSLIVWVFCGFCVEHPVGLTMLSGELPGHYGGTFPGSKVFWLSDGFIVSPQSPFYPTATGNYHFSRYVFTGREYDPETGGYFFGARYYTTSLGRFISRDPLVYFAGPNVFEFVGSNPTNYVDPTGTVRVDIDPNKCLITLTFSFNFRWQDALGDTWTQARKQSFQESFKQDVELEFNRSVFKIYPTYAVGNPSVDQKGHVVRRGCRCPCKGGWTPKVEITFDGPFADFHPNVLANASDQFIRSDSDLGGPGGDWDEADTELGNNKSAPNQVPSVHEFGHLLGREHPGQYLTPKAPPDEDPDYDADKPSLMGRGMDMRADRRRPSVPFETGPGWQRRLGPVVAPTHRLKGSSSWPQKTSPINSPQSSNEFVVASRRRRSK